MKKAALNKLHNVRDHFYFYFNAMYKLVLYNIGLNWENLTKRYL